MSIDLRSDTVTRPTPEMLKYMFSAKVGDDVFNEDPTVNELEAKVAAVFGKEAGIYCPSGSMTNQIAIKVHTQPGDEVICDVTAHIFNYEGGGMSFNSAVQAKLIDGDRGRYTAEQLKEVIRPAADWLPNTSLVSIENTSNKGGGSFYLLKNAKEISDVSHANKLAFHMDGARIFNALTETGEDPKEWGKICDSIAVCFSKGLGAPVGSVLLGTKEFVAKARRVRKVKEDHKKAKHIGSLLNGKSFIESILPVDTNIVIFNLNKDMPADRLMDTLKKDDILVSLMGKQAVRMVTHLDFTDAMLETVEKAIKKL